MKTKILAAGCLHSDITQIRRLAQLAEDENVDFVVLAGDLTHGEHSIEGILGPFIKKNKKVFLVPGNHESVATADFLAQAYGAVNLHSYASKLQNIGLFGCSAANIGPHAISEQEIWYLLKKGFTYIQNSDKKIMVTHVHPARLKTSDLTFLPGSISVTKALGELRPDLLVCAHMHEAEGIEERVGNTRVIHVGKKGTIVEF